MASPPMSLEEAVSQHGDLLYRIALLLADDEGHARQALRRTVQMAARNSGTSSDLHALFLILFQVLQAQHRERRWPWQHARSRRFVADGPLYRGPGISSPFLLLPFEQRRVLALQLLLGYDAPRLAALFGSSEDQIREELQAALLALSATAGIRLPSAVRDETCHPVRALLMRDSARLATDPHLRGHLALCSLCRSFDAAWSALSQQAETAIRNGLRGHALPRELATTLAAISTTHQSGSWWGALFAGGKASFVAVPVIVLVLIGMLVLPGFLTSMPEQPSGAAVRPEEGRALVQKALALIDQPPSGEGVWHAQWETVWYFPNGSYAPILADAWIDGANPNRHRLQTVHGGGGALYELQIGDGEQELWYALGSTYYSSLYGSLGWEPQEPQLIRRAMNADAQQGALQARFRSGIWGIGPAYLREAYNARQLRTLGRQPLGDHVVQIVSFVAPSPFGFPDDDPHALPVTILLGLDSTDGRLRSVTELAGAQGSEQTSRVTWRLHSEEWLEDEKAIRQLFDPRQAWNGRGSFPTRVEGSSIDSALLLYDEEEQLPLQQLLANDLLVPDGPPPGAERLVVQQVEAGLLPSSYVLTYLGEGRQLALSWRTLTANDNLEVLGNKLGSIVPARNQHYRAVVAPQIIRAEPLLSVVIDAQGFSRAELIEFINQLHLLNE